jgi:hypothetical protein
MGINVLWFFCEAREHDEMSQAPFCLPLRGRSGSSEMISRLLDHCEARHGTPFLQWCYRQIVTTSTACGEAIRLVDLYKAALSAFEDVRTPILDGFLPDDPAYQYLLDTREAVHESLLRSRREYWNNVQSHGCRRREGD